MRSYESLWLPLSYLFPEIEIIMEALLINKTTKQQIIIKLQVATSSSTIACSKELE